MHFWKCTPQNNLHSFLIFFYPISDSLIQFYYVLVLYCTKYITTMDEKQIRTREIKCTWRAKTTIHHTQNWVSWNIISFSLHIFKPHESTSASSWCKSALLRLHQHTNSGSGPSSPITHGCTATISKVNLWLGSVNKRFLNDQKLDCQQKWI